MPQRILCFTKTYLFIANGEFAGSNLVVLGKVLYFLDGIVLQNRNGELDVGLGVLVARL